MRISFCTTCANRLHYFRQTFDANLRIILKNSNTEWIILNYNSKDELHEFMVERISLLPPQIIYARDLSDRPWHTSVAKNIAHRLGSGDILVNLDCDNFIGDMIEAICAHFQTDIQVLHLWSGTFMDGTFGRIAIDRKAFYDLGGYDESFHPAGHQDVDVLERAKAKGMTVLHSPSQHDAAIQNNKEETIEYYATDLKWREMEKKNRGKSKSNIKNHRLVANDRMGWGKTRLEIIPGRDGKS